MMIPRDRLDRARIDSPCARSWESLQPVTGDNTRRYCGDCDKHVTDVSKLTRREGMALLRQRTEGRVCVLLQLDPKGQVTTRTPPTRWRQIVAVLATWLPLTWLAGCGESPSADESAPAIPTDQSVDAASPGDAESGPGPASGEPAPLDPETIELLQQLGGMGYLGG